MKAPGPTAAANAVLGEYAAHVAEIQGDANAGLQALLRRIDRGEPPMDLDAETAVPPSSRPAPRRSRLPITIALLGIASAAAMAALWFGGQVGLRSARSDRTGPQAADEAEAPFQPASAEFRDLPSVREPSPRMAAPRSAGTARDVVEEPVTPPAELAAPETATKLVPRARVAAPKPAEAPPPDPLVEVRGLARARAALRDGDAGAALRMLEAHRRGFPRSAYDEERELLVIAALCDAGRRDDARAAGAKFRRMHPSSPLTAHLSGCANESP
jgi:hypothetical protein